MAEHHVEKYLVRKVKELGGETRKVTWLQHDGAPDRLVLLGGRHSFIETKPTEEAFNAFPADARERRQDREHQRLRKFGFRVYVCGSKNQVNDALIDMLE